MAVPKGSRKANTVSSKLFEATGNENNPTIRVLIVSHMRFHRESLEAVLSGYTAVTVVGTAETAAEALERMCESPCDIVLLDVTGSDCFQEVRKLIREREGCRVLALGMAEADDEVLGLAEAGVSGYVSSEATTRQIAEAMRDVMRGESPCSPAAVGILLRAVGRHAVAGFSNTWRGRLTDREIEVLRLINHGLSNKEIAQLLYIELATVKNHVHSILQKLNLNRRAQAASWLRAHSDGSAPGADQPVGLSSFRDLDQKI